MNTMERIRTIFADYLEEELVIADDDPLESADINSIAFIKIAIAIEDEFHMSFDNTMLSMKKYSTLRELCDYVESRIA